MNNDVETLRRIESGDLLKSDLLALTLDADEEIRYRACEGLEPYLSDLDVVDRLMELLSDEADLVRATAVELLGESGKTARSEHLVSLLDDPKELVRGTAAYALGQIGATNLIPNLTSRLQEGSDWEQANIFSALIILGQTDHWASLLHLLHKSDDYRTRCMIANVSPGLPNIEAKELLRHLEQAYSREKTRAACSSLRSSIEELKRHNTAPPLKVR